MMNRRHILAGLAAAPAGLAAPGLIRRAHAQSVLDVASVYSLSGTFANVGSSLNDGSKWAFEQYGTAAGHKLNYLLLDDRGDAAEAVRKVQDAMTQRNVRHVIGCTNSAIGLALQKEVYNRKGIYVNEAGADESTGKDCNKSSFRWPVACYSAVNATVRPLIEQFPKPNAGTPSPANTCSATVCCRTARTCSRKRASSTSATATTRCRTANIPATSPTPWRRTLMCWRSATSATRPSMWCVKRSATA